MDPPRPPHQPQPRQPHRRSSSSSSSTDAAPPHAATATTIDGPEGGGPLPAAAPSAAPSAAVFADALTEAARPCHLYYVYEDDTTLPDLVLAHATVHVDLGLAAPSPAAGEGGGGGVEGPRATALEIRDCRALQPHALRVYGAELAPPGVPSAAAATPNPPTGPSGIHAAAAAHAHGQGEEGEGGAGAVGAPVLRLYGFSKPRVEVEPPEALLEEMERRNRQMRAALSSALSGQQGE